MAVLSTEQIREQMSASDSVYVEGHVNVDMGDVIEFDLEGFYDYLSDQLIGSVLLMDISYSPTSVLPDGTIRLLVSGDASVHMDSLDPDDAEVE